MARRESAARRYAEAAFQVAMRDDTLDTWRSDLELAVRIVGDQRALGVLASPAIPFDRRATALDEMIGGRVSQPVRNLILLMLRRGRIEALARVVNEFRRLDDARQGITRANATSAAELSSDEIQALTRRLEESTGGRIALDTAIDPDLLGGLVVRVGDRMIDGSVRGRLERLRNRLISGAL